MKDGLKHIVGKEIAAVVVAKADRAPHQQVFLVFADGTRFEFWGDDFNCTAGLDHARDIERCVRAANTRVYGVPRMRVVCACSIRTGPHTAPQNEPEGVMTLTSRRIARTAVAKARWPT